MGTKTISIMDDVYELLSTLKRSEESFSDEIRRLAASKGSILEFAGAWKDLSDNEIETMKNAILALRGGTRTRELTRRMKNNKRMKNNVS